MSYSTRIASPALCIVVWAASQGCASELVNVNCPDAGFGVGGPALIVSLRDIDGAPAALGTTVRLRGPGPDQVVTGTDPDAGVIEIGNKPGRFDVIISRPWWEAPEPREIRVPTPEDPCDGFQTTRLFATLSLQPGAPAIRQVVPESEHITAGSDPPLTGRNARAGGYGRTQLRAHLEADPNSPTALEWTATEPEIADVTADGVMTVTCREAPIDTRILVRSQAAPAISATIRVTVEKTTLIGGCP